MSIVELRSDSRVWPSSPPSGPTPLTQIAGIAPPEPTWNSAWKGPSRIEALLPFLTGACLFLVDVGLVVGAFMFAYWMRFVASDNELAALGLTEYLRVGVTVALLTSALFALRGLYDQPRPMVWATRLHTIVSALSTALIISLTLSFFVGDQAFSRLWFATGWIFAIFGLLMWRTLAVHVYLAVRTAVSPATRVLMVGANTLGQQLARELAEWYQVVGFVDNGSDLIESDVPLLGAIADLEHVIHDFAVDEIIIALPSRRREQVTRLVDRGFRRPVKIKFVTGIGELLPERLEVQRIAGRSYIGFTPVAEVSWLKRALDMIVVSLGLIVISPLLGLISLAIVLDSRGPIFYGQERVGKDGRHFRMLKFRSMVTDADRRLAALKEHNEVSGPMFKMRRDPRVTRVGRFIRRWSLDELPQLFNVLRGEMSLVGPRPPVPSEVSEYEEWQLGRLRAVPGLTGLWQVSGRSEVSFHDMVRLDLHYIRNWSLSLDIEILLRTIPAVLTSRGAY
jgi:exopolysaccharide biosynthesis polyprenyl glycosylphosphotransferase